MHESTQRLFPLATPLASPKLMSDRSQGPRPVTPDPKRYPEREPERRFIGHWQDLLWDLTCLDGVGIEVATPSASLTHHRALAGLRVNADIAHLKAEGFALRVLLDRCRGLNGGDSGRAEIVIEDAHGHPAVTLRAPPRYPCPGAAVVVATAHPGSGRPPPGTRATAAEGRAALLRCPRRPAGGPGAALPGPGRRARLPGRGGGLRPALVTSGAAAGPRPGHRRGPGPGPLRAVGHRGPCGADARSPGQRFRGDSARARALPGRARLRVADPACRPGSVSPGYWGDRLRLDLPAGGPRDAGAAAQ